MAGFTKFFGRFMEVLWKDIVAMEKKTSIL